MTSPATVSPTIVRVLSVRKVGEGYVLTLNAESFALGDSQWMAIINQFIMERAAMDPGEVPIEG